MILQRRSVHLAWLVLAGLLACEDPAQGVGKTAPPRPTAASSAVHSEPARAVQPASNPTPSPAAPATGAETPPPVAPPPDGAPSGTAAAPPPAAGGASQARTGVLKAGEADRLIPAGQPTQVRLLEAGAEPRAVLRYAFEPGNKTSLEMGLTMTLELAQGARNVPAQTIPRIATLLDMVTVAGAGEGVGVEATVRDVSLPAEVPQQVSDQLLPHLRGIVGLTLKYRVSESGRVKPTTPAPSGKGGAADSTLAQMTQSLESMIAPFPQEPVGLGARWEVVARFDSSGTELVQFSTFDLRERTERGAKLGLNVKQAAARADVHPPNLPPGVAAQLVEFSSQGAGESEVEFAAPSPAAASMKIESKMTLEVRKAESAEPMRTTMKSSILVDIGRKAGTKGKGAEAGPAKGKGKGKSSAPPAAPPGAPAPPAAPPAAPPPAPPAAPPAAP